MTNPPEKLSENTLWRPAGKTKQAGYPGDDKSRTPVRGEDVFNSFENIITKKDRQLQRKTEGVINALFLYTNNINPPDLFERKETHHGAD
jgi:hypothetical protein